MTSSSIELRDPVEDMEDMERGGASPPVHGGHGGLVERLHRFNTAETDTDDDDSDTYTVPEASFYTLSATAGPVCEGMSQEAAPPSCPARGVFEPSPSRKDADGFMTNLPSNLVASEALMSEVMAAFTITVIRFRTVTCLEFFFNIFSIFKSIFTTFLDIPFMNQAISLSGMGEIPGLGECIDLFENILGMLLLVGSKPGYKIRLMDKDGNVTRELRGLVPKPKGLCEKLFPNGRHIRIEFQDASGETIVTYDSPKKPCCGKRKGAKIYAGKVEGNAASVNQRVHANELKILGQQSKCGFLDNCCQIRKIASKGPSMNFRTPFFIKMSGWPNYGQPCICPDVEIKPPGAGIKIGSFKSGAAAQSAAGGMASKLESRFKTSFWIKTPWPIIASTMAMMSDVADAVGVGNAVELARMAKDTKQAPDSSGPITPVASDRPSAQVAEEEQNKKKDINVFNLRVRNILTINGRLAVDGEMLRDWPIEQRMDMLTGMIWLDQTMLKRVVS